MQQCKECGKSYSAACRQCYAHKRSIGKRWAGLVATMGRQAASHLPVSTTTSAFRGGVHSICPVYHRVTFGSRQPVSASASVRCLCCRPGVSSAWSAAGISQRVAPKTAPWASSLNLSAARVKCLFTKKRTCYFNYFRLSEQWSCAADLPSATEQRHADS